MTEYKLNVNKAELKNAEPKAGEANEKQFAIILYNGKLSILDGVCTHQRGPLGEGSMEDGELVCPLHQGKFDISNGKANPDTSWVTDIHAYKYRVDDVTGDIFVDF